MTVSAALAEIKTLSIEDRIQLVQAIWDTIAEEQTQPDLTESQKKDLTRRLAEMDANPKNVLTWEEIKASIKRPQ